jgi:NADH:ubiquinone oxidoreductase subunit E
MKKIVVEICIGTNCYVMGGAELLELEDELGPEIASHVEIKGKPCFGVCSQQSSRKPPMIRINGEEMSEATLQKVTEAIKLMLKEDE